MLEFSSTVLPAPSLYHKQQLKCKKYTHTHTHIQPFYGPFSRTIRVSWCQKKYSSRLLLDFMVQRKITEANIPTTRMGTTPSQLISDPPPPSHHFYAGCPSYHNPPTLSWLRTGIKYADLYTQWRGSKNINKPVKS